MVAGDMLHRDDGHQHNESRDQRDPPSAARAADAARPAGPWRITTDRATLSRATVCQATVSLAASTWTAGDRGVGPRATGPLATGPLCCATGIRLRPERDPQLGGLGLLARRRPVRSLPVIAESSHCSHCAT